VATFLATLFLYVVAHADNKSGRDFVPQVQRILDEWDKRKKEGKSKRIPWYIMVGGLVAVLIVGVFIYFVTGNTDDENLLTAEYVMARISEANRALRDMSNAERQAVLGEFSEIAFLQVPLEGGGYISLQDIGIAVDIGGYALLEISLQVDILALDDALTERPYAVTQLWDYLAQIIPESEIEAWMRVGKAI
jgi:hypothetical protein